jgi:hypothetical protein
MVWIAVFSKSISLTIHGITSDRAVQEPLFQMVRHARRSKKDRIELLSQQEKVSGSGSQARDSVIAGDGTESVKVLQSSNTTRGSISNGTKGSMCVGSTMK